MKCAFCGDAGHYADLADPMVVQDVYCTCQIGASLRKKEEGYITLTNPPPSGRKISDRILSGEWE